MCAPAGSLGLGRHIGILAGGIGLGTGSVLGAGIHRVGSALVHGGISGGKDRCLGSSLLHGRLLGFSGDGGSAVTAELIVGIQLAAASFTYHRKFPPFSWDCV